ncbi:hypothetical protein ElyMa_005501700 [Elysia marginata]|uniref:Secreted protein n=1 Tax=Elysia marginata TaxID=1093978 RepID=A0AAV4EVT0_9GAST|nr:hypothetical protein ElyMa_005501700 [Elysia marginata]
MFSFWLFWDVFFCRLFYAVFTVAGRNIPSKEIKAVLLSASLWETVGQGRVPTQPPNHGDVKPWKQVVDEVREHSGSTSVYGFVFRCAEQRTSLDAMVRTTAQ